VGEYECDIQELEDGDYVLYDDIKHLLTRPDPAEVERLISTLIEAVKEMNYIPHKEWVERMDKARSDLLKLVGS